MKVISLLFGIWTLFVSANFVHSPKLHIPSLYSPPLGYMSSVGSYGPYPFTKFGVQNPDLPNRDTCFSDANGVSIKWPDLFHAGTDWFALSGKSAASEPVTAIADGFVEWVSDSDANYPGSTIIIRHVDPELGTLYSVYMHLIYPSKVQIGDVVNRGTQIGEVITQTITLTDGTVLDNSHLHWEVRTFADATQQTWFPQACDGSVAGEGYTKDDPTQYGYIDPDNLLSGLSFLPLIQQAPTSTPTPTVAPTPTKAATPTPTATPTPILCKAGVNLVQNGDFEDPTRHYLWISNNPDIALIHPYVTTPEPNYGLVMGLENSAIQTIHQVITVPPAARSVEVKFWLYVDTYELLPFDYDYLYVDVIDGTSATASSLLHEPFAPFTNRFSPQRTWRQQSLRVDDIEAIKQPVHLQFRATTNWTLATEFIIDNVQLITGCQ